MRIFKKIFFFVIFLISGFLINLTFQLDSHAFFCETDENGAILLSSNAVNGAQVVGDQKAPFKFINGKIGDLGSNFTDQCSAEPDEYKVTFYKVGLCTEDPYMASVNGNAGGNPTFTSCFDILNSPSGKTIIIKPDEENNDLLSGEPLNLPIGNFNYFYAIVNNHLHVKHIQSFKTSVGGAADMWGNGDSQEGVRNICYTVAVVTTITGDHDDDTEGSDDEAYQTAHNVDVVDSGPSSNSQLKCTATMNDAVANVAFATEIIDHFGEDGDAVPDNWIDYNNMSDHSAGEIDTSGVSMAANMLQDDGTSLATTFINATRIGMYYNYTNPVVISELTTGFKINIGTSHGISLDSAQVIASGVEDVVQTWMAKVGVDPFTVQIQTREKRRRRGAWR